MYLAVWLPIPVREFQVGIDRELTLKGLPEPVHVMPIEWRLAGQA